MSFLAAYILLIFNGNTESLRNFDTASLQPVSPVTESLCPYFASEILPQVKTRLLSARPGLSILPLRNSTI